MMAKKLQIIGIALLTLIVIFVGWKAYQKNIGSNTISSMNTGMIADAEHCILTPNMPGCESYISTGTMMTGSSMADVVTGIQSYIAEMIPHHQEAIDASDAMIGKTLFVGDELDSLQKIAQNIITDQKKEIRQLKQWLETQFSGSTYEVDYMPMMRDTKDIHSIPVLENMYAEDMIAHHQAAIDMSNRLLEIMTEEDKVIKVTEEQMVFRNEIKAFAENVISVQQKEIKEIQDVIATTSLL